MCELRLPWKRGAGEQHGETEHQEQQCNCKIQLNYFDIKTRAAGSLDPEEAKKKNLCGVGSDNSCGLYCHLVANYDLNWIIGFVVDFMYKGLA